MTAGVFICHASEDALTARRVVEVLESAGVRCWIAPRDIAPGSNYTQAILEGLAAAPALVLVFSAAADISPHVRRELETAVGSDTALFPLRLQDVEPGPSLRYFIGTSQWLDACGRPAGAWEPELVRGVRRLLGDAAPVPLPTSTSTAPGRGPLVQHVLRLLDRPGSGPVTLTGLGGIGKSRVAADIVAARPDLRVLDDATPGATPDGARLTTCRVPLGWPREQVLSVPPLPPEAAHAVLRDATGRDLDDAHVVALCELLGHIPLGLELAAARLRVLGADQLLPALTDSLDLVAPLRDAVAWSLDRLTVDSRDLLELLASIRLPLSLSAMEALSTEPHAALTTLNDVGLLLAVDDPGGMRYVVPHPVRLVALARLSGSDRAADVRSRSEAHHAGVVRDWASRLDSAEGPAVVSAFAAAAPAVEELVARHGPVAVEVALDAAGLWIAAGRLTEALSLTRGLLAVVPPDSSAAARLHAAAGRHAYHLNDWSTARDHLSEATRLGDPATGAVARCYLSGVLLMTGRVKEGRELAERAYAETEPLNLYPQTAEVLSMIAVAHAIAGELDAERKAHERRLDVVRQHGDLARTADALNTLAEIALDEAGPGKARRYAEESLGLAADLLPLERRDATITLARAHAALGDLDSAAHGLGAALASSAEHGQDLATAQCLRLGGVVGLARGDPALAVRLFATAETVSASPGESGEPLERDLCEALHSARASLGEAAQHEWTLGAVLPLTTVMAQLRTILP